MHLQYKAGDRTGALRQFERCIAALDEELGVKPERRTQSLYEQIRSDVLDEIAPADGQVPAATLPEILDRLRGLHLVLRSVQKRVRRDIKAVERGLKTMDH
jgi:hypothetical protein